MPTSSALIETAMDPVLSLGAEQPQTTRMGPVTPLQLSMSPRLATAARIAEASAGLEFTLSADLDELGLDATLRLLDGLLDALETHFEDGPIRLSLDCISANAEQLVNGLIAVPRLEIRLVSESETDSSGLEAIESDLSPPASRALRLLGHAARSEQALTLALRPNTFPIRPFSARSLAIACTSTAWRDRMAPLAARRRAAPVRGPGLIDRELARAAMCNLKHDAEKLVKLDPRARSNEILQIAALAELGFWAPESSPSAPPLIRRLTLDDIVWPWVTVPTMSQTAPYFLCIDELTEDSVESALQVVYGTLHR